MHFNYREVRAGYKFGNQIRSRLTMAKKRYYNIIIPVADVNP